MSRYRGVSLLEILVSLIVASLLMTLIMQQYLMTKRSYIQTQSRLEQNIELQLVADTMRNSLRRGGFTPCMGISSLYSLDRRNGRVGLVAVETTNDKHNALRINRMNEQFVKVTEIISPTKLLLPADIHYEKQELILISDCYHAEVQLLQAVMSTKDGLLLTLSKPLAFDYVAPVYLGEWIEETYFMKKNCLGKIALFYKQKHAEELSQLINSLQVKLNFRQVKMLTEVTLGVEQSKNLVVTTRVRAG